MKYNFDIPVDRTGTNSVKWEKYAGKDIIPLWIADMDFQVAPAIIDALNAVTAHGVLGYPQISRELVEVTLSRLKQRHNWEVDPDWIVWLPGLVPGLTLASMAATLPHEQVMTTVPVYGPFMNAPAAVDRSVIKVPLKLEDQRWTLNFDAIQKALTPQTRLFLLCNPYNPAGTVFTREELKKLGEICLEHNIVICSDEIHCDLILDETKKHISIGSISPELEQQTITLLSPSKTFNIPGLGCSFAIIPNEKIRDRFAKLRRFLQPNVSSYAADAALAAYRDSDEWHQALLTYLRKNHDYLLTEINQLPGFSMLPHEATYLAWIDISKSGVADPQATFEKAGAGIYEGGQFFDGPGFMRINFGTQLATLQEAVARIRKVIS